MNMTEAALNIRSLAVGWYGIMITIGVLSAMGIALIETKRREEYPGHIVNMEAKLNA